MLTLKRKFHSKRHLNSASSSTVGSVSDLEDRVVMLCEDVPTENSFDSGRGSQSPEARSHSEDRPSGSQPRILHLSRHRQASYVTEEPAQAPRDHYPRWYE